MAYSEGLISLAVDLALVGEQVELARIAMTRLADKGYSLSSPEMLEANETFSKLSNQFLALQEQYETYRDELLRNQKTNPALSQNVKAKLFCPEIAGLFCRIAGLFCHDSRANLSLKPVCFGIAIS